MVHDNLFADGLTRLKPGAKITRNFADGPQKPAIRWVETL
jgi:hypothetical protein|tara:strand:+ start:98 stop:217 length:120 start_codon:yes stop_codon:yes gene_type:complete